MIQRDRKVTVKAKRLISEWALVAPVIHSTVTTFNDAVAIENLRAELSIQLPDLIAHTMMLSEISDIATKVDRFETLLKKLKAALTEEILKNGPDRRIP